VLEQGRNDRTLAELDANGDGRAAKAGVKLVGCSVCRSWIVR
jgi:hypothetical protein